MGVDQHRKVPKGRVHRAAGTLAMVLVMAGLGLAAGMAGAAQPASAPMAKGEALSGLVIVVDPGHGGYDGGARARDSGVWEKALNLSVALKTRQVLVNQGATVVLTRETDTDLWEGQPENVSKKRQDMQARIDIAKACGADMVLSIHMNEYRDRSQSGPQVFYRKGSDDSRLLAGCMQSALIDALQPPKERSALSGDYFILQLDVPSVLIECGFLSNSREEALLLTEDYQYRLAQAIVDGVCQWVQMQAGLTGRAGVSLPAP